MTITIQKKIWVFENHQLHEGRFFSLNWSKFDFDSIENQSIRRRFIKSTKDFFRASTEFSEINGNLSPGTLLNRGTCLRRIVNWMINSNIYEFRQLNETHLKLFFQQRIDEHPDCRPRKKSLTAYLTIFSLMWDLRFQYPRSLKFNPKLSVHLETLLQIGGPLKRWDAIEINLALPLIKDSINWMQFEAESVLNFIQFCTQSNIYPRWLAGNVKDLKCHDELLRMANNSEDYQKLINRLGCPDSNPIKVIRESIHLSIGAAIILIFLFSGIRVSELLSLRINCCRKLNHQNGKSFWYMNGIAAKKNGAQKTWVINELVVKAIKFLENLHRSLAPNASSESPLIY